MPKLLQINVTANQGSTGKIAEQIGKLAIDNGFESWIAYGRGKPSSESNLIRIGSDWDIHAHAFQTRIFDNHGLASRKTTKQFIKRIKLINPDIIHLHNIHGYYINYPILFDYLNEWGGHVIWTLHDCWPFTGHCTYFMISGCEKWKSACEKCPNKNKYPASIFFDNSKNNFLLKKNIFTSLGNRLTLVPVSYYIAEHLHDSFFNNTNIKVIHNGIDIDIFKPSAKKEKQILLGVANAWNERKGLTDFYELRKLLPDNYIIRLIGLTSNQIKVLPPGIEGISYTNGQIELARYYSSALALINPTYEDNYPTVNLEAISCGTPVISYNTGGSIESITDDTGIIVPKGDINGIYHAIKRIERGNFSIKGCRSYAENNFSNTECFKSYISLYNKLSK